MTEDRNRMPQRKDLERLKKKWKQVSSHLKVFLLGDATTASLATSSRFQQKSSYHNKSLNNSRKHLVHFATGKWKCCQEFNPGMLGQTHRVSELYWWWLRVCCQPLVQEHLLLTSITPDAERGQIHRQVVLFGLQIKRWNNESGSSWSTELPD